MAQGLSFAVAVRTGLGTGETQEQLLEVVQAAVGELPAPLPRLAQGVSRPAAVLAAVAAGVDLFDAGFASVSTAAGIALTFSFDTSAAATADGKQSSEVGAVCHPAPSIDLNDTRCGYRTEGLIILDAYKKCTVITCLKLLERAHSDIRGLRGAGTGWMPAHFLRGAHVSPASDTPKPTYIIFLTQRRSLRSHYW